MKIIKNLVNWLLDKTDMVEGDRLEWLWEKIWLWANTEEIYKGVHPSLPPLYRWGWWENDWEEYGYHAVVDRRGGQIGLLFNNCEDGTIELLVGHMVYEMEFSI